jgi:hydrogenase maturation factor HypF (carbamoyltransferase family)
MTIVYCDVCKKKVDDPLIGRDFHYYAEIGVCEPCKDNLEYQVKNQIRANEPFNMSWYDKLVKDIFGKAAQKGRA